MHDSVTQPAHLRVSTATSRRPGAVSCDRRCASFRVRGDQGFHLRAPTGWVFPDLTTNRNRDAWVFLSTLNRFVALYCGLDQLHRGRNLRGRSIKEREFVSPIRRKFTWVKGGELESNSHGSLFRMSSNLGVYHQSVVA